MLLRTITINSDFTKNFLQDKKSKLRNDAVYRDFFDKKILTRISIQKSWSAFQNSQKNVKNFKVTVA